jgi:ketosteroid isomerase-like protein
LSRSGETSRQKTEENPMVDGREPAARPEDITRLFAERAKARDAEGLALLYEDDAVLAYPPGEMTEGRAAIRALYQKMLAQAPEFEPEAPLPSLIIGDLALTATVAKDEAVARAQVARRQPDGTWLRILDRPDFRA